MHLWKVVSFYFHLVKETATGLSQVLPAFFLRCFSAFLTVCRHSLFSPKVLVVIENTSFPKNLCLFRVCSRHSSPPCGTPFRPCAPHGRREFFHGLSSFPRLRMKPTSYPSAARALFQTDAGASLRRSRQEASTGKPTPPIPLSKAQHPHEKASPPHLSQAGALPVFRENQANNGEDCISSGPRRGATLALISEKETPKPRTAFSDDPLGRKDRRFP